MTNDLVFTILPPFHSTVTFLPTGQLYIINVLATLNSRTSLREQLKESSVHNISFDRNTQGIIELYNRPVRSTNANPQSQRVSLSIPGQKASDIEAGVHIARSVVTWDGTNYVHGTGSSG
ncbi:hypothetical protein VKT23_006179 [Stygiomarasmius scandens]|uniref:Uncharacterized protein n=1 Tax=Marasmiellus scandens TaxID=2682957 RepID=A0ABR1JU54_9AGAR